MSATKMSQLCLWWGSAQDRRESHRVTHTHSDPTLLPLNHNQLPVNGDSYKISASLPVTFKCFLDFVLSAPLSQKMEDVVCALSLTQLMTIAGTVNSSTIIWH